MPALSALRRSGRCRRRGVRAALEAILCGGRDEGLVFCLSTFAGRRRQGSRLLASKGPFCLRRLAWRNGCRGSEGRLHRLLGALEGL